MSGTFLAHYYLGVPLGVNHRKEEAWTPIINKIKKRLSGWKSKILSRTGRLTLIKSVLNSLPLYYLALFRMPKKVAKKIISLPYNLFWGVKEGGELSH